VTADARDRGRKADDVFRIVYDMNAMNLLEFLRKQAGCLGRCRKLFLLASPDPVVFNAICAHPCRVEQVSAIKDHKVAQLTLDEVEIG